MTIEVSHVTKQYSLGRRASYQTLRDTLASFWKRERSDSAESFLALDDVSFQVKPGEAVALVGNNGSGKSTMLKIISRITYPSKGFVRITGRVASLLEVGTGFHPELTGRENTFLSGSVLGMSYQEIKAKFDEIVAFAEIEAFIDTPVKYYSSGMYVRLAFSVAAHLEPEILIVDEVLAVGDLRFQKKCLDKMKSAASSGKTVLFVSHNIAALRSLCVRGILLNRGKMEMDGPIESVASHYLQQYCATSSAQTWEPGEGPGNAACRFLKVRLHDREGHDLKIGNLSEEVSIELTYEVLQEGTQVAFAFQLYTDESVCAFSSLSNREPYFHGKALAKGTYVTRCSVPGHTLNNGHFFATVQAFGIHWEELFSIERVIAFEMHDDGILKGDFHGSYSGLFRPNLVWQTEQLQCP